MAKNDITTTTKTGVPASSVYKPTDEELTQLQGLLQVIATDANALRTFPIESGASNDCALIHAMKQLVSHLGWYADIGTGILDGTGQPDIVGDADDWFNAPIRQSPKREAAS